MRFNQLAYVFGAGLRDVSRSKKSSNAFESTSYKSRAYHFSSNSSFRSSPHLLMAVRRKRRGSTRKAVTRAEDRNSDESDGITTLERIHSPVTDPLEFNKAASRLLDKIEKAMEPMKSYNEIFVTQRANGELGEIFTMDLGPKVGLYQIEMSQDEGVFEFSSPVSGKLLYCLSSATGEWVNVDDGHQFEGILVRDLLRSNCIGSGLGEALSLTPPTQAAPVYVSPHLRAPRSPCAQSGSERWFACFGLCACRSF